MSPTPTAQDMELAREGSPTCTIGAPCELGGASPCSRHQQVAQLLAEERERAAMIAETFDDFCFPDDIAAAIRAGGTA